jgi:hypothetical protein
MTVRRKSAARPSVPEPELSGMVVPGQALPMCSPAAAYIKWFFDFLRTDLATLTPGQLLAMRADAHAFLGHVILDPTPGDVESQPAVIDESLPPFYRHGQAVIESTGPTAASLQAVQREARAGLQRVRDGEWFHVELEGPWRLSIVREGNRIIRLPRHGTFRMLFLAAAIDVVEQSWPQLRECPGCHTLFWKVGKQKFCTLACGSRTHWLAFKARRSARDYRREYNQTLRKRIGPVAKVKIKPKRRG